MVLGIDNINKKLENLKILEKYDNFAFKKEVAQLLIKRIHNTEEYDKWITYIEYRPFNDQRYYISNQKLKDLGWNVTVGFKEGIKMLV